MEKPVIIFGATGIAKAALEIFESNSIVVYGFLDEDKKLHNTEINNVPVLGDPEDRSFLEVIGKTCEAFVATDDNSLREDQVSLLTDDLKVMPTNAIHQSCVIASSASIGHGNFINGGVILGTNTTVGQHCLIHSGAILEQDVEIGDFVQIGAGSRINANVKIGNNVFIGSGAVIVSGITIGEGARIGAGSVVVSDVNNGKTVFGNPAVSVDK